MNTYKIELYLNDLWHETDVHQSDFVKNEVLHSGLKTTDSTIQFTVVPDLTLCNLLRGAEAAEIPVRITKNTNPYFYGFVRKTFSIKRSNILKPLKIEAVAQSYLLKRKIGKNLFYSNISVSQLLINLLLEAGVASYTLPTIATIIPAFSATAVGSETYHNVIQGILFEYGYTFYFNEPGSFISYKLFPDSVDFVHTFTVDNCIGEITQTKSEQEKEKVIVKWTGVKTISDAVVFSDTTGARDGFKCLISMPPDSFLGNAEEWYPDLSYSEGEILSVSNLNLDILKVPAIVVYKFEAEGNRVKVSIKNTSPSSTSKISKLDIKAGSLVIKKDVNCSIVTKNSETEKIETVESKYIFDKQSGDALASGLAWWYKYSDYTYQILSKDNYPLGEIEQISATGIGTITARVIKKQTNEKTGIVSYELEGMSEYVPDTATGEIHNSQPTPTNPQIESIISSVPATIYNGYSIPDGDATVTPVDLAPNAEGAFKSIIIKWNKQTTLTNLLQYKIQVSEDNSSWYSLRFDRIDWKGPINEYTIVNNEMVIHTLPTVLDETDSPVPQSLYYRVRQETRQNLVSNFVSCFGVSKIIENGDITANSITANKLEASILTGMVANISDSISISEVGFSGTTYDATKFPAINDRRMYLDKDELTVQKYIKKTTAQISSPETASGLTYIIENSLPVYYQPKRIVDNGIDRYVLYSGSGRNCIEKSTKQLNGNYKLIWSKNLVTVDDDINVVVSCPAEQTDLLVVGTELWVFEIIHSGSLQVFNKLYKIELSLGEKTGETSFVISQGNTDYHTLTNVFYDQSNQYIWVCFGMDKIAILSLAGALLCNHTYYYDDNSVFTNPISDISPHVNNTVFVTGPTVWVMVYDPVLFTISESGTRYSSGGSYTDTRVKCLLQNKSVKISDTKRIVCGNVWTGSVWTTWYYILTITGSVVAFTSNGQIASTGTPTLAPDANTTVEDWALKQTPVFFESDTKLYCFTDCSSVDNHLYLNIYNVNTTTNVVTLNSVVDLYATTGSTRATVIQNSTFFVELIRKNKNYTYGYFGYWEDDLVIGRGSSQITCENLTITGNILGSVPIGFIYIQYPLQDTPDVLFGTTGKWSDISSQYAGLFFRVAGGSADAFEATKTIASAGTTTVLNITAHGLLVGSPIKYNNEVRYVSIKNSDNQVTVSSAFTTAPTGTVYVGQNDAVGHHIHSLKSYAAYNSNGDFNSNPQGYGAYGPYGDTLRSVGMYDDGVLIPNPTENRVVNQSVKVWKRVS